MDVPQKKIAAKPRAVAPFGDIGPGVYHPGVR
jgi:hypothetical protein